MHPFTKGKKILKTAVIVGLLAGIGLFKGAFAQAAEEFQITTTQPVAGQALELSGVENGGTVKWFVDDREVTAGEQGYVPVEADYEKWIRAELYRGGGEPVETDRIYFSKLPVVYIDTGDGGEITTKTEYKDSTLLIQGNASYGRQYDGAAQIKLRGNSSLGFPQKPYKIKLEKGTNLFGFGKNKHWVLLSSFMDQCALRNRIGSDLSAKLGLTNMKTTWVDVVINGQYAGMYTLSEQIRIGKSRVNILDWEEEAEDAAKKIYKNNSDALTKQDKEALEEQLCSDFSWVTSGACIYQGRRYEITKDPSAVNITGGYLFELSDEYDELSKFMTPGGFKVMLKAPEYLYTNDTMMHYVEDYWTRFEQGIQSVDGYNAQGEHYTQLADFDSMVEYWLTMEIMGNDDAARKSRYVYKDEDDILQFGPVWDFDWGCGSYTVGTNGSGWKLSHGTLWKDFIDDPYFQVKAGEYYWKVRGELQDLIEEGGTIDSYIDYLKEAGRANDVRYPYIAYGDSPMRGFTADAKAFKQYMKERIEWLDQVFADEDTATGSMYMTASRTPYTRSAQELLIRLDNGRRDKFSAHMAADGILKTGEQAQFTVSTASSAVQKLSVYVNGIHRGDYDLAGGSSTFAVDAAFLTEDKETRNVVSVFGRDADGNIIYKNYAALIVKDTYPSTISFDSCSGSAVSAITAECGSQVEAPQEPVREGYRFLGWYLDPEGTQSYVFSVMPEEDVTLYALWERLVTPSPSVVPSEVPSEAPSPSPRVTQVPGTDKPIETPLPASEEPVPSAPQQNGSPDGQSGLSETKAPASSATATPKTTRKPAASATVKNRRLIRKVKKGKAKNTIIWKKVKGAKGYRVYAAKGTKNRKGKYTAMKCIASTRKTKAVHRKVKAGTWYRYRVEAYVLRKGKKVVPVRSRIVTVKSKERTKKSQTAR